MVADGKMLASIGEETSYPPSKFSPPSNNIAIPLASLEVADQVNCYRSMLAADASRHAQSARNRAARNQAYQAEAQQEYLVGETKVNIFAPFDPARSAFQTFTPGQRIFTGVILLILLALFIMNAVATSVAMLAVIMVFYFGNLLLTFWLSVQTLEHSEEVQIADEVVHALADAEWPRYTILCPLYRETEVVEQFASAMGALDYPTDKLQILFLTEEDDEPTRAAIQAANLPPHFEIITVPDGKPRTKPRACNYGLLQATGDFLVIFDAEDVPDPLQLKKAVLTFLSQDSSLGCVQAKLNFYNSDQNILTRLFTIEYSAWFEMTLPGLQQGRFSIPLGGTSNHFRVSTLQEVGAWDAYNVTEDCDLGLRLSTNNFRTLVLDSTTYEEANPSVKNWIRQRSRWIKGYFQTYLVHMRNPRRYLTRSRIAEFLSLQLIIGGRTVVLLVNPLMWILLTIYMVFRIQVSVLYENLFPAPVLYMAVISMVLGNLLYIYIHFTGCVKRRQYGLVKWGLLLPAYWILGSTAALKAIRQLILKPHHWEKTIHGLHLNLNGAAHPRQPVAGSANLAASPQIAAPAASSMVTEPSLTNGNGYHADYALPNGRIEHGLSNGHAEYAASLLITTTPARKSLSQRIRAWLPKDRWLLATIILACVAGLAATLYFFLNHQILLYKDSSSHLGIARLVFDNTRPGFAHLGGIWLPLPHLAMIPFAMVDFLWRTGLAGACVSMPSYVITALYIFLTVRRLTGDSKAGFIGSLVFILNPNALYLQATPLTEPLAAATITAACYHLLAWIQEEHPIHLLTTASATFLASLARYDGWALFIGFLVLIPFISLIKRQRRHQIEANTIIFALFGGLGIAVWILWCALILGDPLYWQRSEYSSQGQHEVLIAENRLYTYHNPQESARSMLVLSEMTMGPVLFGLSVIGLAAFLIRKRFSPDALVGPSLLIPLAFYTFSLYSGQVSINLPSLVPADAEDQFFNARFGMISLPPSAVFVGVLAGYVLSGSLRLWNSHTRIRQVALKGVLPALLVIGVAGQSVVIAQNGIISLQDGQFGRSCQPSQKIADYMARHYSGGKVLLDTFTNSSLYVLGPVAGVEFKNLVYEGTQVLWDQALEDPGSVVDWIVLDPNNPKDKVAQAIDARTPRFLAQYTLVVEEAAGARGLYRRNTLPETPERPIRQDTSIANELCEGY